MFETMALRQPPRDPLQVPGTVLRWTRYALALDDETMAVPQPAAPTSQDRARMRIDCRKTAHWRLPVSSTIPAHVYEVRLRKDKRGTDLISDVLPVGRLWYGDPNAIANAIGYAQFLQPFTRCRDLGLR